MDYPPLDLEEFVKGFTLAKTLRILSTEQETNTKKEIIPGLITIIVEGQFESQQVGGFVSPQTLVITMRIFVLWSPDVGMLRFTISMDTNIELLIEDPDDRWEAAVNAVNKFNHANEDGLSTALAFVDEDDDLVILMQQTNVLAPKLCETPEGLAALKIVLGLNLSRFFGDVFLGKSIIEDCIREYAGEPPEEMKEQQTMH
jgi:hypothetical protein